MEFEVFAERERAGWSDPEIIDGYIGGFGPVVDAACDAHLSAVPGHGKILDVCCGQGTLTARLLARGLDVAGLDFSEAMLELARRAAPGAAFLWGDAQELPFEDGIFDAVVCNFGMMHIPDQPRALAEIARVLKPGGVFSMTSWVGPEASDAFRLIFANARANMPAGIAPPPQPDLFVYGRPTEAEALLRNSGLAVERHVNLPLAWELEAPGELFQIFLKGTVGARITLMTLDEDSRSRVAAAVGKAVETDYRAGEGYRVPAPVAHIVARPI
jgi:SAM-dependent methyltransferase